MTFRWFSLFSAGTQHKSSGPCLEPHLGPKPSRYSILGGGSWSNSNGGALGSLGISGPVRGFLVVQVGGPGVFDDFGAPRSPRTQAPCHLNLTSWAPPPKKEYRLVGRRWGSKKGPGDLCLRAFLVDFPG